MRLALSPLRLWARVRNCIIQSRSVDPCNSQECEFIYSSLAFSAFRILHGTRRRNQNGTFEARLPAKTGKAGTRRHKIAEEGSSIWAPFVPMGGRRFLFAASACSTNKRFVHSPWGHKRCGSEGEKLVLGQSHRSLLLGGIALRPDSGTFAFLPFALPCVAIS